jgi:hypothetical protein
VRHHPRQSTSASIAIDSFAVRRRRMRRRVRHPSFVASIIGISIQPRFLHLIARAHRACASRRALDVPLRSASTTAASARAAAVDISRVSRATHFVLCSARLRRGENPPSRRMSDNDVCTRMCVFSRDVIYDVLISQIASVYA